MTDRPLRVSQSFRHDVRVAGDAGEWTYRFGGLPKPCVHPLVTAAGHRLSGFEMSDHVWHRGLWFTIKYINQTNYWEEIAPFGVQVTVGEPDVEATEAGVVRIRTALEWSSEATGLVLQETRRLTHRVLAGGVGVIDWSSSLHFAQDLTLDRTPYTTWGGYGGLAFRSNRELHNAVLTTSDCKETNSIAGTPGDWVLLQGLMDGGVNQKVAIGMIDHPSNPRSPSPWYCKVGPEVNLMNAAFLFNESMSVAKDQTITFHYRVLFRDGHWSAAEFGVLAAAFRAEAP